MRNFNYFFIFLFFATISGNAQAWQSSKTIKGNGKMTTTNRTTADYENIALTGSMDVVLVTGKEGNLKIEAEENLMQYIITEVVGEELNILVKKGISLKPSSNRSITITVPYQDLQRLSLTGSGDISSSEEIMAENFEAKITGSGNIKLGLQAKNARASVTGSGDIELKGSSTDLNCKVTGSGNIRAFGLECQNVDAMLVGSGKIQVNASEELIANIPGAGDIVYIGNPKKESFKTLGAGSISKR